MELAGGSKQVGAGRRSHGGTISQLSSFMEPIFSIFWILEDEGREMSADDDPDLLRGDDRW